MAEPWTEDFANLGERTAVGVKSLDHTRLAIHKTLSTQDSKMRLFKTHPALTALIILAFLGIAAPVAYAIVDKVWLSVDVDKSAPEIESDVQSQLDRAGVPATVHAERSGNSIGISIKTADKSLGSNLDVVPTNLPDDAVPVELRLEVLVPMTDAQNKQLETLVASDAFTALLDAESPNAAAIKQALADGGFKDADVKVTATGVTITIKTPPR